MSDNQSSSYSHFAVTFLTIYLMYIVGVGIHRLYFSPYSKFPGPKLAGLTYAYMFYYDGLGVKGQYIYKIQQMHEEYASPIIRIGPYELHVNDPEFYNVLFAGGSSKRNKPTMWSPAFGDTSSLNATFSHEEHRLRRNALAPFFSTSSLRKLESTIQSNIARLITVFRNFQSTGVIVQIRPAFGALTNDIIAEYCFGISDNYIEAPDFNSVVMDAVDKASHNLHFSVQLPWIAKLVEVLPDKLVASLFGEGMALLNEMKNVQTILLSTSKYLVTADIMKQCVVKILEIMHTRGDYSSLEHRTIFHELLDNQSLPEADKSVYRLTRESQLLLAAGTVTTATALASALVYLILDEKRFIILLKELEEAIPDSTKPLRQAELEKLPYLSAVIKEVLRLVSGVSHRLIRSAPTEALQLGKWAIPPNTAVSMHAPLIHHSPKYYPEPWSFIPERWFPSPSPSHLPTRPPGIPQANPKYLMPFSRGNRNCIGQPLAHAELYMTLANVLRSFARLERDEDGTVIGIKGMRLFETDRRDTDMRGDFGFPEPEPGRGNMRIILE